jgi:hypothetical protein
MKFILSFPSTGEGMSVAALLKAVQSRNPFSRPRIGSIRQDPSHPSDPWSIRFVTFQVVSLLLAYSS